MVTICAFVPLFCLLVSIVHAQDRCTLEPDPGPCRAFSPRWFYNQTSKACESFIYGGCRGTVPFDTEEQCEGASCDPCLQKPETGPCEGLFTRYFFNAREDRCQPFTWGGCDGVVPFETKRECKRAKCVTTFARRPRPVPLTQRCVMKPDPGPCRRNKTRWFWDEETMTCKSFRYGGCFGSVPFHWRRQCRRARCGDDLCSVKPDPGPCRGSFRRWFYNSTTDQCESFSWGGCRGRAPFVTRPECEASLCIRNRCQLKPDGGPCEAAITKYFFNQETGKCESFTWGGCFGLVPYDTLEQCEDAGCEPDNCNLKADNGPCDGNITKWWFDPSMGRCASFRWGGCDGRVPFDARKECLEAGCARDACRMRPETGVCRALFLKWFWNEEFGRCESFIWGGCGGVVPFDTRIACEEALCGGVDYGNNDNSFSQG